MTKRAKESRIALTALAVCLCLVLAILSGCQKQEPTGTTGSEVSSVEPGQAPTPGQILEVEGAEKSDLRILYAGLLETDRAKDFVAFLSAHFETVGTTDYLTFKGAESAGFDVTIIDHDGTDFEAPRLRLSPDYAHATIAVGVPGAFLCQGLSLKTGYL